jgi:hypothetical protein
VDESPDSTPEPVFSSPHFQPQKLYRIPAPRSPMSGKIINRTYYDDFKTVLPHSTDLMITDSDDAPSEEWLIRKHQDCLNDFTDLSSAEQDYLKRWNLYIFDKEISCFKHIPEALKEFIQQEQKFLREPGIPLVLGEHMAWLSANGIITLDEMTECTRLLEGDEIMLEKECRYMLEPGWFEQKFGKEKVEGKDAEEMDVDIPELTSPVKSMRSRSRKRGKADKPWVEIVKR